MAVTVLLTDDVDISRGDAAGQRRRRARRHRPVDGDAGVDGRRSAGLATQRPYTLKHTTRRVRAMVTDLHYLLDVHDPEALGRAVAADTLTLNEIGLVSLRLTEPVFVDDYRRHRVTGSFVLIDEATHQTVAAGMIRLDGGADPTFR